MAKSKAEKWLTEDGLLLLNGWARRGLTDAQIAKNMGISRSTLNVWRDKYPEISDTLKQSKEAVDLLVENALLKRALGYSYEEKTYERRKVANLDEGESLETDTELLLTKVVTKHMAPDTTAQIYWLKNRRRDLWHDNMAKVELDRERLGIDRERLELDKRRVEAEMERAGADEADGKDIKVIFSVDRGEFDNGMDDAEVAE